MKEGSFDQPQSREMLSKENQLLRDRLERQNLELDYLRRRVKALESWATKDPLTEADNRRGLEERLHVVDRFDGADKRESKKERSILMLDIDDFKVFNDRFGHDVGDRVLRELVAYLREKVRHQDVVARWGGEEFVVAFQGATAQDVVNKFWDKAQGRAVISFEASIKGQLHRVTMSGGVVDFAAGEDLESVVQKADAALYRAKDAGKNHITMYREQDTSERSTE